MVLLRDGLDDALKMLDDSLDDSRFKQLVISLWGVWTIAHR